MKRSKLFLRLGAVVVGLLVAALGGEAVIRIKQPYTLGKAGLELPLFGGDQGQVRRLFQLDPELGYVPILGTELYDDNGFLRRGNDYDLSKSGGRERILFLGDSVTRRAKIVKALRDEYGDAGYEYWNAGVTAYNTQQEVAYYERHAWKADPDHIVLTFHLNDFYRTPISFHDADGRLQVISPNKDLSGGGSWLFEHSQLYRFYIGRTRDPLDMESLKRDIREALGRLMDLAAESESRLTVVVLPNLQEIEEWHPVWQLRYDNAIEIMEGLGVRYFSLLDSLREALTAGVDPEESPGDTEHPSAEVAAYFGRYLKAQKLFEGD